MSISLPALPALVAGRALKEDAATAAWRALDDAAALLHGYDLAIGLMHDLPEAARPVLAESLRRRLGAADRRAKACQERLDEVTGFVRSLGEATSPTQMVEVSGPFFEMLSPYLDEAMEPMLRTLSRRAGAELALAQSIFPQPGPSISA